MAAIGKTFGKEALANQDLNTLNEEHKERCILIGLARNRNDRWEVEDHLTELDSLARTSGAEVIETFVQNRLAPDPAYFIGKGKLEEIALFIEENQIDLVIFDDELSPAQIKNIERLLSKKVIDRAGLILDIFAGHARTKEAKVQVELAQLNYLLPRLTRQWQHLSRQVGGIGTKGPGETQLETDRRLIRQRIAHLKNNLARIDHQRKTQRKQRKQLFRAALIGYTNAGKSTLLNALSGAHVLIEDKLFATLDTTVRRVEIEPATSVLLSDTVGFIRKLPHHLVASFRSTLAEAAEADLLLHVVDISHPQFAAHIRVVRQLLNELHIEKTPQLLVFNKVDRIDDLALLKQVHLSYPEALFVSARRKLGLHTLKQKIAHLADARYEVRQLKLNLAHSHLEHRFYALATILNRRVDDDYLHLTIKYPAENKSRIRALIKDGIVQEEVL